MPLPRYVDDQGKFDVSLVCLDCGWAIAKDSITKKWTACRRCGKEGLKTRKYYYSGEGLIKQSEGKKA